MPHNIAKKLPYSLNIVKLLNQKPLVRTPTRDDYRMCVQDNPATEIDIDEEEMVDMNDECVVLHSDDENCATESSLLGTTPKRTKLIKLKSFNNKIHDCNENVPKDKKKYKRNYGTNSLYMLLSGILSIVIGILLKNYPLFDILMRERLRMTPGLPSYNWWLEPPVEIRLQVFIFNITNSDEFISGEADKLNVQEVGPIIFREHLKHSDVVWNENGTLSFTEVRTAEYLPDLNEPDILNRTIIVPNMGSLGLASYLHDASMFTKFAMNLLLRSMGQQPMITTTVGEYLWNLPSPVLGAANKIAPFLVPIDNLGIITNIYRDFTDRVTVNIGTESGDEKFFLLTKFRGGDVMPGFEKESCKPSIVNSSEGVMYPQHLTKQSTLKYFRKTLCKVTTTYFDSEVKVGQLNSYKYILPNNTFDRLDDEENDCYTGQPPLPSGLSDVSKCFYTFPVAATFPHMYTGGGEEMEAVRQKLTGLKPNETRHGSYIIVEPITGIPVDQCARSQSNLVINKLQGFNRDLQKFSDMVIPMFWAEYHLRELPLKITASIIILVNVLPIFEIVLTVSLLVGGATLFLCSLYRIKNHGKITTAPVKTTKNHRSPRIDYSHYIRASAGLLFKDQTR